MLAITNRRLTPGSSLVPVVKLRKLLRIRWTIVTRKEGIEKKQKQKREQNIENNICMYKNKK
jgi:hypothetical protein